MAQTFFEPLLTLGGEESADIEKAGSLLDFFAANKVALLDILGIGHIFASLVDYILPHQNSLATKDSIKVIAPDSLSPIAADTFMRHYTTYCRVMQQ